MGRGRAKAKQTKVARELKYREFNTDFNELQRELHGDTDLQPVDDTDGEDDDPYAERYDDQSANRR